MSMKHADDPEYKQEPWLDWHDEMKFEDCKEDEYFNANIL